MLAAMPATPDELLGLLAELGLRSKTYEHPPVFTVEESKRLRGRLPGGHCKSLFLKDKADRLWLVVALEDRPVDLKALRRRLDARKTLSFGSAALLMAHLGVTPGAVTPFGVINDSERRVQVVLERRMLGRSPLNYHPLVNDRTIAIQPADLLRFLRATGHEPLLLDLEEAPPEEARAGVAPEGENSHLS